MSMLTKNGLLAIGFALARSKWSDPPGVMILLGFRGHPETSFELKMFDGSAGDEGQATVLHGGLQALERKLSGVNRKGFHEAVQL